MSQYLVKLTSYLYPGPNASPSSTLLWLNCLSMLYELPTMAHSTKNYVDSQCLPPTTTKPYLVSHFPIWPRFVTITWLLKRLSTCALFIPRWWCHVFIVCVMWPLNIGPRVTQNRPTWTPKNFEKTCHVSSAWSSMSSISYACWATITGHLVASWVMGPGILSDVSVGMRGTWSTHELGHHLTSTSTVASLILEKHKNRANFGLR